MPQEGNLRIKLIDPAQGAGKEVKVWAVRDDRGGTRRILADATSGRWETRFETRDIAALSKLSEIWRLIDERGIQHTIERVNRYRPAAAATWIRIYAVRTQ